MSDGLTIATSGANASVTANAPTGYSPAFSLSINGSLQSYFFATASIVAGGYDNINGVNWFSLANHGDLTIGETGKALILQGTVSASFTPTVFNGGTNASSSTYLRGDGTWSTPAGGGNVSNSGASTNNHVTVFSGTSGQIIADSGLLAPSSAFVGVSDAQTLTNKTIQATGASWFSSNVGIGTNSPIVGAMLDIKAAPNYHAIVYGNGSEVVLGATNDANNATVPLGISASAIKLNGTVTSASWLGVGVTPAEPFHVRTGTDQTLQMCSGTQLGASSGIGLNTANDANNLNVPLVINASVTTILNSVGFGTYSPAGNFDVESPSNNNVIFGSPLAYQNTLYFSKGGTNVGALYIPPNISNQLRLWCGADVLVLNNNQSVTLPAYGAGTLLANISGNLFSGGYVTPQMYGAAANGSADDTTALSNALNSGKPVFLDGLFLITSMITVATGNQGVCVFGAGGVQSQIRIGAAGAGITVNLNYSNLAGPMCVMKDFTFIVQVAGTTAYALSLIGNAETGSITPTFDVRNVNLMPLTSAYYANYGMLLKDVRNGVVDNCQWAGYPNSVSTAGPALKFWSSAANSAPCNLFVKNCAFTRSQYGVLLEPTGLTSGQNDWEGVWIADTQFLQCQSGVFATTSDGTSDWLRIRDCNFNFGQYGVYAPGVMRVCITGSEFQGGSYGNSSSYAMWLANCANYLVDTCIVNMENITSIGTRVGVHTDGGSGGVVGASMVYIDCTANTN